MTDLTYVEYPRKDATEKNKDMQEYNLWREQHAIAIHGRELHRRRLNWQKCIEFYQEWVEKSPEKLSAGYKKESTDES